MAHSTEDRRICDLVAVEVQDRQHRAVACRVQELVALPACCQRPRLRLAISDCHRRDQIRVVEHRAEGMGDRVPQLAAFVDGARRLRSAVGRHTARERELLEELLHALLVAGNVRIDVRIAAVEIVVGNEEVSAVSGTRQKNQVEVIALYYAVQVNEHEVLSRDRAPVADDLLLDVGPLEGSSKQRVVQQVELPCREIVCRPPPGVHLCEKFFRNGPLLFTVLKFSHTYPPPDIVSV